MNFRPRVPLVLASAAVSALAIYALPTGEIIAAEGRKAAPIYDPSTVAGPLGSKPRVLGTLRPGERVPVVGCGNRKSDIDIQVSYGGAVAVLGGGQGDFILERKPCPFGRTTRPILAEDYLMHSTRPPNSALLSAALHAQLRRAHRAAKRERWATSDATELMYDY